VFIQNKATGIHIIINEFSPELAELLNSLEPEVPLNIITKTTISSLHSFSELLPFIKSEKICLTTVDTVFNEEEFAGYIKMFEQATDTDALMAVTRFIDDESPLYVGTDKQFNVIGFYDEVSEGLKFISGGIYCFSRKVFPLVAKAIAGNTSRMRNFQRLLVSEGLHVKAHLFSKIIDIDHISDIEKAKQLLRENAAA
jgi:NDP-sugar pyrophosphorylase family protein